MRKGLLIILCLLLVGCSSGNSSESKSVKKSKPAKKYDISFVGVGDNLIHSSVYEGAAKGDGTYDFSSYYTHTNYLTQVADLAFINQETPFAGTDYGLSNYPQFNGPNEVLDGVVSAGFDWLNAASNHSFDRGSDGIVAELAYAKKFGDKITITGIHDSQKAADTPQVINVKGLKVGVASFTYGLNGYTLPSDKPYLVDLIDTAKIKRDIKALKKVSDVQIVNMHWGAEYSYDISAEQKALAQQLADLGVDAIIGEHPHVIEGIETIKSKSGQKVPCFYSMGNFLSAQLDNFNMLGYMPSFNIKFNSKTKKVTIGNIKVYPTVTYISTDGLGYATYALKDYSDDVAATHYITTHEGQDCTRAYFINLTKQVIGDSGVTIEY